MDTFSLIGIPLITELLGICFTLVSVKILRKPLKKWLLPSISDVFSQDTFKTALDKLLVDYKPRIKREVDDYIFGFLEGVKQHPETVAAMLEKPADLLVERFTKKLPALPAGEGDLLGTGLSMVGVPKKWIGLARLAKVFMGDGDKIPASTGTGNATGKSHWEH